MQRAAAACCVLLRNHLRCPYRRILEALCPANPRISPDSHDGGINDEENRDTNSECSILQDSSFVDQFATFAQESSVALLHGLCWETCATQETSARSPPGRAPSQERTYAQLLSAYSSHSQVSQYVKSILMRLVPRRMWGSRRGKRQLLRAVSVFVRLKRRERMSLAHIMSSIDVSDFPWTKKAEGAMGGSLSFLRQWVRFLFNELVVQILRWNFYCTETEPYGATVFYYRKAVWREIVAKWVHEHANGVLLRGPITHDEVNRMLKRRQYGYAKLRLLPKASNVRPIMNMAARLPPVGGTYFPLPANAALRPVFEVLKYEVACQPHLIGASVGNFGAIRQKLRDYICKVRSKSISSGFYIVVSDIQSCYDTMRHDKLMAILKGALLKEEYMIKKSTAFYANEALRRIEGGMRWRVIDPGDYVPSMQDLCDGDDRNCIVYDNVVHSYMTKEQVLSSISTLVEQNVVSIESKFYVQSRGIPQGSILSTIVCNIYYGRVDAMLACDSSDHMLMRLVDDYIFVSTDRQRRRYFWPLLQVSPRTAAR